MKDSPKISVVMAVYNERPYLRKAIRSILDQTFEDFEFIIINDGSTDGSKEVLERFAGRDDRIRLVHQENQGLAASLNRGISLATGRYLARMDGDDISHPERFEMQVQFLREDPEIGAVGAQLEFIDAEGQVTGTWPVPTDPNVIAWRLLFNSCLPHPGVMIRRVLLKELDGYDEQMPVAQDYELWVRAIQVSRLVNLPDILVKVRRHEGSVTTSKREDQIRAVKNAAISFHRALLGSQANEQKSKFLVWMDTKSIERAVEETGVQDFAAVHDYVRRLYWACDRQLCSVGTNVQARQRALLKLDVLAGRVAEQKGRLQGMLYDVRARCMAPVREIVPWGIRAIRQRIERAV